jgi:hypothetical protein
MIIIFIILSLINFAIAAWNAYSAGYVWREVSGFMRLVVWLALIMSACGFCLIALIMLCFVSVSAGWMSPKVLQSEVFMTYVLVLFPISGTVVVIKINHWVEGYKNIDFTSLTVATWNSGSQISNVTDVSDARGAEQHRAIRALVLLLILMATVIGVGFTALFFLMGRKFAVPNMRALANGQSALRQFMGTDQHTRR